jgi:glutaconyl-CoA/methylmalonyl-CoA decarboxylase subunit gamma
MKDFKFKINGNDYDVYITNVDGNIAELEVNGTPYKVEINRELKQTKTPKLVRPEAVPSTDSHPSVAKTVSPGVATSGSVKSPLPGTILSVNVKVGDIVKVGQRLLQLEAMKMENNIDSDKEGRIAAVNVKQGDSVMEGDVLIVIETIREQKQTAAPKQVQPAAAPTTSSQPSAANVASPSGSSSSVSIKSPLPGTILSVNVKVGDTVKVGQRLLVLEAMKMENNIDSQKEGRIAAVKVKPGDSVMEGDVLIVIEELGKEVKQTNTPKQVQPEAAPVAEVKPSVAQAASPKVSTSSFSVKSPLPGTILSVNVKVGDTVKAGQRLLVLEAMKMENNIDSERDGRIAAVKVKQGDSVMEGDVLIVIE